MQIKIYDSMNIIYISLRMTIYQSDLGELIYFEIHTSHTDKELVNLG